MTLLIDIREQIDVFNGVRPVRLHCARHPSPKNHGGFGPAILGVISPEKRGDRFAARRGAAVAARVRADLTHRTVGRSGTLGSAGCTRPVCPAFP